MILKINDLSFSYNGKPILKDINFSLNQTDILAVLGKNGSGKSTLLKNICRILKPHKGIICINDEFIQNLTNSELAKKIAYLPQKNFTPIKAQVYETILIGRKPHIKFNITKRDEEIVDRIVNLLNLQSLIHKDINELSGGEFQKVLIARALVQEPELLLLDEPINHLDIQNQMEVMSIIVDITKKLNLISIIVLHDINIALRFANKFLLLRDGYSLAFGDNSIITPENIKKTYEIDVIKTNIHGIDVIIPV